MIITKFFIGCHVPAELRIQLNQNAAWKQSRVLPEHEEQGSLLDVVHQRRNYLGYAVPGDLITLAELQRIALHLKAKIRSYCEEYPIENVSIYVFPQQLVS